MANPTSELKRDGVAEENEREGVCKRKDGRGLAAGGPKRSQDRERTRKGRRGTSGTELMAHGLGLLSGGRAKS